MATRAELERLLGHALNADKEFRSRLCKDPAAAADSIGISLDGWQVTMLKSINKRKLSGMARSAENLVQVPPIRWEDP